jgi:hypothetical protein
LKIALCFRGIARSLKHTVQAIRSHIVEPANQVGEVRIFTHLFDQAEINNPRSGEVGELDRSEYLLLESHEVRLEPSGDCLALHKFEDLKAFGDPWNNEFTSLRNLVHELHSLKEGWRMARAWQPDVVLFLRPDLLYQASFSSLFDEISKGCRKGLCLPIWQGCWGANDRYAIATTYTAADTYANRIDRIFSYCEKSGEPLHAEIFLLHCLREDRTPLWFTSIQARRIRAGGALAPEKFSTLKGSNLPAWYHGLITGFARF